jgi:RNA-directed DNA polymerase
MAFLKYLLSSYKLTLNESKTKVLRQSQKQYITGAVVNKKISADPMLKKSLRQQMYYIQKHGLDSHMHHSGIEDPNYIHHLAGQIQWVLFLEKKNTEFKKYKDFLSSILKASL